MSSVPAAEVVADEVVLVDPLPVVLAASVVSPDEEDEDDEPAVPSSPPQPAKQIAATVTLRSKPCTARMLPCGALGTRGVLTGTRPTARST